MRILLLSLLFPVLVLATPQGNPTGKVVQIVGSAKAAERALGYGDAVYAGEVIRTDAASRVKILMTDRSIIDIGEDSAIRIRTYPANLASDEARSIDLELGSIRASVKKSPSGKGKFFIRTKSSVLAVRGTEFWTTLNKLTVSTGAVDVGTKTVNAGQTASFDGSAVTEIHNLSEKQVEEERNLYFTNSMRDAALISITGDPKRDLASVLGAVDPRYHQVGAIGPGGIFYPYNVERNQTSGVPVTVLVSFNPTAAHR